LFLFNLLRYALDCSRLLTYPTGPEALSERGQKRSWHNRCSRSRLPRQAIKMPRHTLISLRTCGKCS